MQFIEKYRKIIVSLYVKLMQVRERNSWAVGNDLLFIALEHFNIYHGNALAEVGDNKRTFGISLCTVHKLNS